MKKGDRVIIETASRERKRGTFMWWTSCGTRACVDMGLEGRKLFGAFEIYKGKNHEREKIRDT